MINLVTDNIDTEDISELIEWLKTNPRLTKGELTEEFEQKWADAIGVNHAVFVNSGSSANLLMLYTLIADGKIKPGDSVVVPTLSWATDIAPVVQLGLRPVLCDCNMNDLSLDIDNLRGILESTDNVKAVLLVSVLGLVPDMNRIREVCNTYDVILLEDCCESLGSCDGGVRLGSFGLMSSFSTYFGHHLSTIEGGVVCTNDRHAYNTLKSLRSHGWDRDLDRDYKSALRAEWDVSDFEALYTFYNFGFNCRPTDLQAKLGLRQLDKLDDIIEKRATNYYTIRAGLRVDLWKPANNGWAYESNFAYPVITQNRDRLVAGLVDNNIECRPLLSRSMGQQPVYIKHFGEYRLPNAERINREGLYVPNNQHLTGEELSTIIETINQYA